MALSHWRRPIPGTYRGWRSRLEQGAGRAATRLPWTRRMLRRYLDAQVLACVLSGPAGFPGLRSDRDTIVVRSARPIQRYALLQVRDGQLAGVGVVMAGARFGAGIHVLTTAHGGADAIYVVQGEAGTRVHRSPRVRSWAGSRPTRSGVSLAVDGPWDRPTLHWRRPSNPRLRVQMLLVISAATEQLVSAVYTWDTAWTFPVVERVPYVYHRPLPPPRLDATTAYKAVYLAVEHDGWVSHAETVTFRDGRMIPQ